MGTFSDQLKNSALDVAGMAAWLNGLTSERRIQEARSLSASDQRKLWTVVAGQSMSIEDMVPSETAPLAEVIHYGRNTLPVFKIFEKRFCRPASGEHSGHLWGYNEGSTRGLVGPGYFVCRPTEGEEETIASLVIDYTLTPAGKVDTWPEIRPNESGLSRLVYAGMKDYMRKVSDHVSIGRAHVKGKVTNNYFILCRG